MSKTLMRTAIVVWAFFFSNAGVGVDACAGEPDGVKSAVIGDLHWMAGAWAGDEGVTHTEEHWMAPRGKMMLGMNRSVSQSGKTAFEFLRIRETEQGVIYYAGPGGRPPTAFPLKEISANHAVFENPDHDFPRSLRYQRKGDTLTVTAQGVIQGKPKSLKWVWKKTQH